MGGRCVWDDSAEVEAAASWLTKVYGEATELPEEDAETFRAKAVEVLAGRVYDQVIIPIRAQKGYLNMVLQFAPGKVVATVEERAYGWLGWKSDRVMWVPETIDLGKPERVWGELIFSRPCRPAGT
jgi:hypothetical protein